MDFILALPLSRRFGHGEELFDVVMFITNKFTKAVKVVPGKNIYTATDWTSHYWQTATEVMMISWLGLGLDSLYIGSDAIANRTVLSLIYTSHTMAGGGDYKSHLF